LSTKTLESNITAEAIAAHTAAHAAPVEVPTAPPTDFEAISNELRAENERLKSVLAAAKISSTPTAANQKSAKPVLTAERFKALVGPVAVLQMTRQEKLSGLGLDPSSVSDDYLKQVFGRGADGAFGQELIRTSPQRYYLLREAAIILGIYCA
jgi:hypothetical protein